MMKKTAHLAVKVGDHGKSEFASMSLSGPIGGDVSVASRPSSGSTGEDVISSDSVLAACCFWR